jgi:hypothetical protein
MIPFPREVAAILLIECQDIMGAIDAQSLDSKAEGHPLPSGLITCGELCRLVPALVSLLHHSYPELWDEEILSALLRDASLLNNQSVN